MLIKRIFLPVLILCLLFSTGQTSPKDRGIPDSITIQKFIAEVQDFEMNFYNSDIADSVNLKEGMKYFDQLIESYTLLDLQYPDSNFADKAFMYLEKKKNLNVLTLFKISDKTFSNYKGNNSNVFENLKDSTRVSETDRNLFSFMQQPVAISDLQNNFLNDHDAILDFWIKDNKICVFILTEDSLKIVRWDIPIDQIKIKINALISPFYGKIDLFRLEFNSQISYQLYQYLFQPLEQHIQLCKVIYVIADDFLIGFPFELLVTDTTINKKYHHDIYYHGYRYLNYLIKKYAISYNYSTATFALVKGLDRTTKKLGRRLLTMSEPIIPQNLNELLYQMGTFSTNDLFISDYSHDEIKRVSRLLFRHDILKKEAVIKKYLFVNGYTYRWLYFALPGILDNLNPLNSGLLFSTDKNDTLYTSNWLSVNEAMKLNLAADLLSLSASQLRSFHTDGNPGVIALPQSFLLSGVKSVLFSLWRINSISTSQFMSKFYWELKYKRQTNAQALQEAKVASMKDTFIFNRKQISRAHPYFWATFQLIGNPKIRPPSPTKIQPWGIIIIVYVCVVAVSLYITRKTLPGRR